MVSPETEGTACRAAKSQSASVSPGESHVTSAAGRSRVPHMAAAGGSWPRSWGRSCLVPSPPRRGEGEPCRSVPPARGPSSHARREAWAEPSAGSGGGNGAKEHAFGAVQQKRGRAAAALPGVEIPEFLPLGREALSPQEDTHPCPGHHGDGRAPTVLLKSLVAASGRPAFERCMEEACSIAGFLCGETEARGSGGGRTSCLESF